MNETHFSQEVLERAAQINMQFPLALLESPQFRGISIYSKVIYCVLLYRSNLSIRNAARFTDDNGVFVYCRQSELVEKTGFSDSTIRRAFSELENIGLIQTKKQFACKPQKVYVRRLSAILDLSYLANNPSVNAEMFMEGQWTDTTQKGGAFSQNGLTVLTERTDRSNRTDGPFSQNGPIERNNTENNNTEKKRDYTEKKQFSPPSLEEVEGYIREKGYQVDAELFVDWYSERGWKLANGKKMKNWRLSVKTWNSNHKTWKAERGEQFKKKPPVTEKPKVKYFNYLDFAQEEIKAEQKAEEQKNGQKGDGSHSVDYGVSLF